MAAADSGSGEPDVSGRWRSSGSGGIIILMLTIIILML